MLLSVHLITYNNEQHIEETLISILKQEVDFEYEIVIGDDCSTDNTLEIIKQFSVAHPNLLKVHKNETRLGILKNFKTTLDRCTGKYVFDIAGDDYLNTANVLQKFVNTFKTNPDAGFIDCGYDRYDENSRKTSSFINRPIISASTDNYTEALKLGQISPVGLCYNKEKLLQHVDFDRYIGMGISIEDYPILVDLAMNSTIIRLDESLVTYRSHEDSYSHKKDFDHMLAQRNEMKELFDYFGNKYTFSKGIVDSYYQQHYKQLLFLAGYFHNKRLGKEVYNKIKPKSLKDHIHYWASQSSTLRKLIGLRKKIF